MFVSDLPVPIKEFLAAAAARKPVVALQVLAGDAELVESGKLYRANALREWVTDRFSAEGFAVHPIYVAGRGDKIAVTVMCDGGSRSDRNPGWIQFDWVFVLADAQIAALTILEERREELPAPVADYIRASNTFDVEGLVGCFVADALVNDQLRNFWGTSAIREWAASEIVADKVTLYVVKVVEHYGDIVVTAHVDGEYDKTGLPEPLALDFHFSVRFDKLVRLIILHNRSEKSPPAVRTSASRTRR